jgi:nitrogen fixation NifU-like protein
VEKEKIKDIKFETFGCAAALSTSSVVTDLAKGKTITQALKIKNKDIVDELGGLPVIKIHCSLLAIDALQEAIYDYLLKNKKPIPEKLKKNHQRIKTKS